MVKKIKLVEGGFTLVELLIVIVIIGLLASLVAPQMFSKVGSTKIKTAVAQMQMFQTALDTYRLDNGDYPDNLQALIQSNKTSWDGPYLPKDVPNDPWNHPYHYVKPGSNGKLFDLMSYGRDGQPGGEDEDADIIHE